MIKPTDFKHVTKNRKEEGTRSKEGLELFFLCKIQKIEIDNKEIYILFNGLRRRIVCKRNICRVLDRRELGQNFNEITCNRHQTTSTFDHWKSSKVSDSDEIQDFFLSFVLKKNLKRKKFRRKDYKFIYIHIHVHIYVCIFRIYTYIRTYVYILDTNTYIRAICVYQYVVSCYKTSYCLTYCCYQGILMLLRRNISTW